MDRLSIEFINAFGMNPLQFVGMAAALGVGNIGMAASPITDNPHGFAPWDLRTDPALVRDLKTALADHGVKIQVGEGFLVMPGSDIRDSQATLDVLAEIGAPIANVITMEQDRARSRDQLATLAQMADQRGMRMTVEFMPLMWPANLADTVALVKETGAANASVMVDAMHFFRGGGTVADIAAVPASAIGYIQVCDVPMPARTDNYGEEARHERMCPGDGDLPLLDFLRALPRDLVVGLEVPLISKAKAGIAPIDAIRPCVEATRELLTQL